MRPHLLVALQVILLFGCTTHTSHEPSSSSLANLRPVKVRYAKGFVMKSDQKATLLTIQNPWQNASGIEYSYLLSDTLHASVITSENHCRIKTPVKKVICLSTTHIGFIGYLDELPAIQGISGKTYVVNDELRNRIDRNDLPDVGYDENLNYEIIVRLKPDVVFAYGVSGTITGTVKKLNELGIPVVLIAEYLEEQPLAKMEWVKVFGAFFGKEMMAEQKFDSVAEKYEKLAELARKSEQKPAVLLGLPWRGTWYVSGGKSYIARLIEDAGGNYVFRDLGFADSRPQALEKVFERAVSASFWLNSGDAQSIKDIFSVDERFSKLPAVKLEKVYNNNRLMGGAGGNAFYESGVVEPEIILSDLVYILHPQLLPSHRLKYYQKLQ